MSQVLVWKSDADGKLFEDKKKYQAHLRKLARERNTQRKIEQSKQDWLNFVTQMGQVTSFKELEKFVADNWDRFYFNGLKENRWRSANPRAKHELVEFKIYDIYWKDSLSNSHSCPRGGKTNWWGKDEYGPKGYPGWRARVNIRVRTAEYTHRKKKYFEDGFGSDYFKDSPINTGTGGGGGERDGVIGYSYDCSIWADDFPVMAKIREQEIMWKTLGGKVKEKEYAD